MGIIYPDNQNRGNRVVQLAGNIGQFQSEVIDSLDRIDTTNGHIKTQMDTILAAHGLQGLEEMKDKLMALLTPQQKAEYEASVKHIRDQDETTNKILDASLMMTFIAGTMGLTVRPLTVLINTGALAASVNLLGRGFRLLLSGDEMGLTMMSAAFRTGYDLARGVEITEEAAHFVRVFRTAAAALTVLGVVLDGVILIYEAIEGAKQRDELEKGIWELYCRRHQAKSLEMNIFSTESYTAQVQAFLVTSTAVRTLPKETQDQVLGELTKNIVDGLKDDLSKITDAAVWEKCKALDDGSGSVYHDDDPKKVEDVQSWVQAQPPLPSAPAQPIPPAPAPKDVRNPTDGGFDMDAARE